MKTKDTTAAATAELKAANIEPALTPSAARLALGGISPATEHRWNKSGILTPLYLGGRKLYRASHIHQLLDEHGSAGAA
jgi:hypothetical protein